MDGNQIWDGPGNADNDEQSDKDYWNEHDSGRSENSENWEQIENQLNYLADMDKQYWMWRKEIEYRAYLERKLQNQQ